MPIEVMLAKRKMPVRELAERVGITPANLAVLKNGRAKAVRFAKLAALCEVTQLPAGQPAALGRPRTPRADDVPPGAGVQTPGCGCPKLGPPHATC